MAVDYYKVLGVDKNASEDELKKQYRLLSKKYHPDLQNGKTDAEKKEAEEKFKEINEAYSVLGDPEKRKKYDTFGSADNVPHGFGGGGFDPMGFFRKHFHSAFGDSGFGFDTDFGHGPQSYNPDGPKDGRNVNISIEISFEEALYGVNKKFDIQFEETCQSCKGTGAEGGETITCPSCYGTGYVVREFGGMGKLRTMCSMCNSSGRVPKSRCHVCHGKTTTLVNHEINIIIPRGVENGDTLKVAGEGEHGLNGGRNGDLFITLRIGDCKVYKRAGLHLQTTFYLPSIAIGVIDRIDVNTPWGYKKVEIPKTPETDGTYIVKVPGYGVRRKSHGQEVSGDLYVQIVPEAISNLTNEQKKLAKKLYESLTMTNTPLRQKHDMEMREFNDAAMPFKK